jgi:2-polyprenyl-3-methyl-5-hydroxy-6-metoxy-1,4-benzoquinol methylase
MTESISKIYETHHKTRRQAGFSILKDERGNLIKDIVGSGKKVLDVGCRDGALTHYFCVGNDVLGVDIDTVALEKARELGIRVQVLDLNGPWRELGEEKFDVVVAGEVLEHLYNPQEIIEKVSGRLVDGGIFVGSVPNAFSLINRLRYLFGHKKNTPLSDPTHINQFHAHELEQLLRRHFRSVRIKGLSRFPTLSNLSPNLFGFDLFFICHK